MANYLGIIAFFVRHHISIARKNCNYDYRNKIARYPKKPYLNHFNFNALLSGDSVLSLLYKLKNFSFTWRCES